MSSSCGGRSCLDNILASRRLLLSPSGFSRGGLYNGVSVVRLLSSRLLRRRLAGGGLGGSSFDNILASSCLRLTSFISLSRSSLDNGAAVVGFLSFGSFRGRLCSCCPRLRSCCNGLTSGCLRSLRSRRLSASCLRRGGCGGSASGRSSGGRR